MSRSGHWTIGIFGPSAYGYQARARELGTASVGPGKLTYHLELLGGSADLVIDFESPVYLYAVMLLDAFGDTTY